MKKIYLLFLSTALITSTCLGWKGTKVKNITNNSPYKALVSDGWERQSIPAKKGATVQSQYNKIRGKKYNAFLLITNPNTGNQKKYKLYDKNWKIYNAWNDTVLHDKGKNSTKCINITINHDGSLSFSNTDC